MLNLEYSSKFKRDFKLAKKRNLDIARLQDVIATLRAEIPLPEKFHDHALSGNYAGFRECHISSDWLLIYKYDSDILMLYRTGTHSDLFR